MSRLLLHDRNNKKAKSNLKTTRSGEKTVRDTRPIGGRPGFFIFFLVASRGDAHASRRARNKDETS